MAALLSGKRSSPPPAPLDIDDYDVDDDPFASEPEDKPGDAPSKKRKDVTGLGIDEEVAVAKKARIPNVKLDETRLLSEKGIPRLRRKAGDLKFKGKGHEFSDTAKLLSLYQLWLDDLFPKARFLDALAMVEKAGHKKYLNIKRVEWINEGKPKSARLQDEDEIFGTTEEHEERDAAVFPSRIAPIFLNREGDRPKTPQIEDDVPDDDDDLYGATPKASKTTQPNGDSLFGNGGGAPDDDDLDALMAEEEAQRTTSTSLFGNGSGLATGSSRPPQRFDTEDEDDLDAMMAEAEADITSSTKKEPKSIVSSAVDNEDDLDAILAESESQDSTTSQMAKTSITKPSHEVDADEEAAMAEMDGLW